MLELSFLALQFWVCWFNMKVVKAKADIKENLTIMLNKNNLVSQIFWAGAGPDGHAEPHAGQDHLWDEQWDLPHLWQVPRQMLPKMINSWLNFSHFSLLSFYIPMVIMVTTYALTIHHLRFIFISFQQLGLFHVFTVQNRTQLYVYKAFCIYL